MHSLIPIAEELRDALETVRCGAPIRHTYNPLVYAFAPHRQYLERFGRGERSVLLVGMNAGYFGMAQTGIPFGDVVMVRDWLRIEGRVVRPKHEHPKRPIDGFACRRREVSGQRLWGWARDTFGTPERFFARFFVVNYCPLCFLGESGVNLALDKLAVGPRKRIEDICDEALHAIARTLHVRYAIGVGKFAAQRVASVLGDEITCGAVPHPSPANARLRGNWGREMERALASLKIATN
jgi:single-strand selective monofunctional uracil DNA glycosylase